MDRAPPGGGDGLIPAAEAREGRGGYLRIVQPARRDLLLAIVAVIAVAAELVVTGAPVVSLVAATAIATLVLLRSRPLVAVVVITGASAADAAAGGVLASDTHSSLLVAVLACFALGRRGRSTAATVAGAAFAAAALTAANQLAGEDYSVLDDLVFFTLILGAPTTFGVLLRRRAEQSAERAARAATLRERLAEAAAASVAEERAHVAIGVHDAVAHRVGEISLQAAGAARVADSDPQRARVALASIEAGARAALEDIREVIGVLRRDEAEPVPAAGPPAGLPEAWPGTAAPPPRAPSRGPWPGQRADLLLALAVFGAIAVETLTSSRLDGQAWLNLAGVAAVAAPLAARRRHPLAAAAGTYAGAAVQTLLLTPLTLLVTPIVLLLVPPYSVGAHLPRRGALVGLGIFFAGMSALGPSPVTGGLGIVAWAAGRVVRDRAAREERLRAVNRELEATQDAHAARARAEERLRIARELHDAVAHNLTVVVLQAGAAQRVWERDPAAARIAVEALTAVARDTLTELRDRLRGTDPDALRPQDSLTDLLDRVRSLGVATSVRGDLAGLPPEAAAMARQIVQEALTNAVRHAAPTHAHVVVRRDDDDLHVCVRDSGRRGAPAPAAPVIGTGTGLQGLAERLAARGGELRHGPRGPGYAVEARLPIRQAVPA
jgi:signal transduction histidine kinase